MPRNVAPPWSLKWRVPFDSTMTSPLTHTCCRSTRDTMARQLYQLAAVQAAFAARIQQKVQDRRDQSLNRAEEVPLLGWLLAPLTGIAFDLREGRNVRRGERGEE